MVFIYIFFPETYGKTLEELHFCESRTPKMDVFLLTIMQYLSLRRMSVMRLLLQQAKSSTILRLLSFMKHHTRKLDS